MRKWKRALVDAGEPAHGPANHGGGAGREPMRAISPIKAPTVEASTH